MLARKSSENRRGSLHPHIDVFVNDWGRSVQRLIGRVRLTRADAIEIETFGEGEDEALISAPIRDDSGRQLSPNSDPVEFYKWLPAALRGSHLGATESHNGNCPFRDSHEIPFRRVDPSSSFPAQTDPSSVPDHGISPSSNAAG